MRPVNVQKFKYKDTLASKRRQSFQLKGILITLGVLVVLGAIGYALFYAPWLRVTSVTLNGLTGSHQDDVRSAVEDALGHKTLGLLVDRDILFTPTGSLVADITSQFSFIQNISIQKKYFHTLNITATEREAEGVWCFGSGSLTLSPDCRYFDHNGVTFGQAVESSGVLLLNVDDMRTVSASTSLEMVDTRFLQGIETVVPVLTSQGVKVKNIMIPLGSYTEFDILVSDPAILAGASAYPVKFSLDSDIQSQLDVFRIFRSQKMADGTLHPQYIDLRFDGRVYYK